jgi:formylglycine-generating enzyme required for sulfatase activity
MSVVITKPILRAKRAVKAALVSLLLAIFPINMAKASVDITLVKQVNEEAKEDEANIKVVATLKLNMVIIPAGNFRMGCVSERNCKGAEKPVHQVSIKAFKLGATEITFDQWDACVAAGMCYRPSDKGFGRGNHPVINVSWDDIQVYLKWLNALTDGGYRLPSEAEWEYAARSGSQAAYSWGNSVGENRANCADCGSQWSSNKTVPVKSFSANAFGLYDMHGNVWEWTQDCDNTSYQGAPSNGSAWLSGICTARAVRGGSWISLAKNMRVSSRAAGVTSVRISHQGFRLAQDL